MSTSDLAFLLPWNGAMVAIKRVRPLNFLVGPAGAGKLRFAEALAAILPDAKLLGADRAHNLQALLKPLHDPRIGCLIVDLPELDLPGPRLAAFMQEVRAAARLPAGHPGRKIVLLVTRSARVIDLAALDRTCSVIYFPNAKAAPVQVEAQAPAMARRLYDKVAACLVA